MAVKAYMGTKPSKSNSREVGCQYGPKLGVYFMYFLASSGPLRTQVLHRKQGQEVTSSDISHFPKAVQQRRPIHACRELFPKPEGFPFLSYRCLLCAAVLPCLVPAIKEHTSFRSIDGSFGAPGHGAIFVCGVRFCLPAAVVHWRRWQPRS